MPAYLSSRVGRNLRVGVRLGKRRKSSSDLSSGIFVLLAAGIIYCIATTLWPYLLALLIGIVVLGTGIGLAQTKAEKRAATIRWGHSVEEILHTLGNRQKLTPARQRRECDQAIELLERIKRADSYESIIEKPAELIRTLQSIKKTTPLLAPLKRADLAEFKGSQKQSLNACLDLLFLCKTEQISNQDLLRSALCFKCSGEPLSIDLLHEKCVSLGWNAAEQLPPNPPSRLQDSDSLPAPPQTPSGKSRQNFSQAAGAMQCPYCTKMAKTERGIVKHLMGTVRYGGHELSEREARKLAKQVSKKIF